MTSVGRGNKKIKINKPDFWEQTQTCMAAC